MFRLRSPNFLYLLILCRFGGAVFVFNYHRRQNILQTCRSGIAERAYADYFQVSSRHQVLADFCCVDIGYTDVGPSTVRSKMET